MGKVDGSGKLLELLQLAAHVVIALLESLQAGRRLAAQAERRRDLGPIDLESCASLQFFGNEEQTPKLAQYINARILQHQLPAAFQWAREQLPIKNTT